MEFEFEDGFGLECEFEFGLEFEFKFEFSFEFELECEFEFEFEIELKFSFRSKMRSEWSPNEVPNCPQMRSEMVPRKGPKRTTSVNKSILTIAWGLAR